MSEIQQWVHKTKVHDLFERKQHLIDVWDGLGQSIINDAIDEWHHQMAF